MKDTKEKALDWWKDLAVQGLEQRRIFLKYYNPFSRTQFSLTDNEIEKIWLKETQLENNQIYKMKELILKILLENTVTERRYIGGGEEPIIITFKNSEDENKEHFLSNIADEIVDALNNTKLN